jgi:hypothetical protein
MKITHVENVIVSIPLANPIKTSTIFLMSIPPRRSLGHYDLSRIFPERLSLHIV